MKKLFTLFCAMAFAGIGLQAQNITVENAVGQSPATFVATHLLGEGVHVFNVKYNNSSNLIANPTIGTFNANGYGGLQMQNGIIMTTGDVNVAPGPNSAAGLSTPIAGYYSDPEMQVVATGEINSCSTLDFDFVSLTNSFNFNFCFASEEYPEYVCSNFNDVFAFFITGPDPVTLDERTWNIALIPGSITDTTPNGIAVAINSVNSGTFSNSGGSGCYSDFSNFYVDNDYTYGSSIEGIQYDGYTSKMSATTSILPCVQYHMHISICNVGDNAWDSGVFLEGNSFSSPSAAIGLSHQGIDTLWGSCDKVVPLTLAQTDFDHGTIHFSFGGTAEEGVDFECVDVDGMPFGEEGMAIDNDVHPFILRGLYNADLSEDKTVDVFIETSLCPDFPQLVTHDTMHFVLVHGGDVRLRDTTITCSHACFEVSVPVEYGEAVSYQWIPETGIDDPHSGHSTAMIFESTDYQVIAVGGTGCNRDTATVHVVITGNDPDAPVGIDGTEGSSFRVYPNPVADVMHLDVQGLHKVEVIATDGKVVYTAEYNNYSGTVDIPTEGLADGTYGVRLATSVGVTGTRVVVKH